MVGFGFPAPRDEMFPNGPPTDPFAWTFDQASYNQLAFWLSQLPVVGDIGVMADSFRSFEDYMKNRGLTWDDIVYPWMAGRRYSGGSFQSVYGSLNFVSSNLNKLYR